MRELIQIAESSTNRGWYWNVRTHAEVSVGDMTHTQFAIRHGDDLDLPNIPAIYKPAYDPALLQIVFDHGWVRCSTTVWHPTSLNINSGTLEDAQACVKFYRRQMTEFVVDVGFEYTPFSGRYDTREEIDGFLNATWGPLSENVDPLSVFSDNHTKRPLSRFPKEILPAGTRLWHGTDSDGDFELPDGPCAWFTVNPEKAAGWAGWADTPMPGRSKGQKKVMEFSTTRDIELFNITDASDYFELCFSLTGDPEFPHMAVARALIDAGGKGWIGHGPHGEVMIGHPEENLRFLDLKYL